MHQIIRSSRAKAAYTWMAVSFQARLYLQLARKNHSTVRLGTFFYLCPPRTRSFQYRIENHSVDTSIRLTYHPRTTKASRSGFVSKSKVYAYSQRITVFNTRTQPAENVIVLAQVPVSQDTAITVKITNPALPPLPPQLPGVTNPEPVKAEVVQVSPAVTAEWEDLAEGRFKWNVKLAPQEKLTLELEWEVSAATGTIINGL